jgi:hypothetical protein
MTGFLYWRIEQWQAVSSADLVNVRSLKQKADSLIEDIIELLEDQQLMDEDGYEKEDDEEDEEIANQLKHLYNALSELDATDL